MIQTNCFIFISCCILNILAVPRSVCRVDFRWDDCGKPPKPVIYYWNRGSRCEVGMWKGCLPNPNMFANEYECINTCVFVERSATPTETEEPEKIIQLNVTIVNSISNGGEGGDVADVPSSVCRADFRWDDCGKPPKPVFYYRNKGSRCEKGMWKGCLPNPNMFADEYECINTCVFVERPAPLTEKGEPEKKNQLNLTIAHSISNGGPAYSTAGEGGDAAYDQKFVESVLHHKYKYIPEMDTWLRLHIVPQTWERAFRQCQLEGGVLVFHSSENMTNAMLAMMKDRSVIRHSVFIGNHALMSEGDRRHESSDGRQDKNKNCVTMLNGKVENVSCNSNHSYFCRMEKKSMVFNKDCNTTFAGYTYSSRTQSCYKFFSKPETWHEADRMCTAEGTHLAIINSDIEAEVLKDIYAKNPTDNPNITFTLSCHIGYRLWDDGWRTIYGQNITEAGYDKWAEGQPDNAYQTQYTGGKLVGSGLNDLTETDLQPFFCESSPEYNPHYFPQILTTLFDKNTKK